LSERREMRVSEKMPSGLGVDPTNNTQVFVNLSSEKLQISLVAFQL